jgi:hypothetical protein
VENNDVPKYLLYFNEEVITRIFFCCNQNCTLEITCTKYYQSRVISEFAHVILIVSQMTFFIDQICSRQNYRYTSVDIFSRGLLMKNCLPRNCFTFNHFHLRAFCAFLIQFLLNSTLSAN